MKGIEADPGRERKIKQRFADRPDSGEIPKQALGNQAIVFEEGEYTQIDRDADGRRQRWARAGHCRIAASAGNARREQQQPEEPRLLPRIEYEARSQQPFDLPAPHGRQVVDDGDDGEKDAKDRAVEQHARVNADPKRASTSSRSTFRLLSFAALRRRSARLHQRGAGTGDKRRRDTAPAGFVPSRLLKNSPVWR